jgi:cytochrome c biogenesis protein ResB
MDNEPKVSKNPMNWWKIGLCALGVLMIAGAIIYSLVIRNGAGSSVSASPAAAPAATAKTAQTSTGIGELNWVKNISQKYANSDFIFVVLPGSADSTKTADQTIAGTIEKIKGDGVVADVYTLNSQDPEFQVTADRLKISKFPAVLLFAATGNGAIINGDITETKLLQAYLTVQQACIPGNSGCCP